MIPHTIIVGNVNNALPEALNFLKVAGIRRDSRNGPVIVAPGPVITVYRQPQQRVLFSEKRNANPFFHFFEALWMLGGRNDVEYLTQFNPRMVEFSDNGEVLNGAYGYRWRKSFLFDQLDEVIEHLKINPDSRREVITMWYSFDLLEDSKDLPCNTHIYVDIREGKLNITVCNRSNDLWWGAYGANVVHMSFLQEYLAACVGVRVGTYTQFSNNFHIYTQLYDGEAFVNNPHRFEPEGLEYPEPHYDLLMRADKEEWDDELNRFLDTNGAAQFGVPFFSQVAEPMMRAWDNYSLGHHSLALADAKDIAAPDWRLACIQWISRRIAAKEAKK